MIIDMLYEDAIKPHVSWIKEQIMINDTKMSGEIEIGIKMKDLKEVMGREFMSKNDNSFYQMVKDILLENGIKMRQNHDRDENKVLYMSLAEKDEIIDARDVRCMRHEKTRLRMGLTINYHTNYDYIRGRCGPMDENPDCSLYFGEYIEREYIMQIFEDAIPFQKPVNKYGRVLDRHKPYDWECKNGYKIKHIASCIRTDIYRVDADGDPMPYFAYSIKKNPVPDYFILSAWDDRESLDPGYVWMIKGRDNFRTQNGIRPFWDRDSFHIYITKKGIRRMYDYDIEHNIENVLNKLKDICNVAKILEKTKKRKLDMYDDEDITQIPIGI